MNKILKLIKKHKSLAIIGLLALVLFIIMLVIFLSMLLGGKKDKYGNRLEGINSVKISKETYTKIEDTLKETERVSEVSTRLQGKIVYINITYNSDISVDTAKEIASSTLSIFSEQQLMFYDVSYLLSRKTNVDNSEDVSYHIIGTKHPSKDAISWARS